MLPDPDCWSRSPSAPTSISTPPSTSSGTRLKGSTCVSTPTPISSRSRMRSGGGLPDPDLRPRLVADPAAVVLDEWPVAERARAPRSDHGRPLAQLRLDPPRRRPLRPEGPLAAPADRSAEPHAGAVRARPRYPPRRADDLAALREHGWTALDPASVAATPDDYRRFVQGSWAEFGLAKLGLRRLRLGLVQRSERLLPGKRPPRDR